MTQVRLGAAIDAALDRALELDNYGAFEYWSDVKVELGREKCDMGVQDAYDQGVINEAKFTTLKKFL